MLIGAANRTLKFGMTSWKRVFRVLQGTANNASKALAALEMGSENKNKQGACKKFDIIDCLGNTSSILSCKHPECP